MKEKTRKIIRVILITVIVVVSLLGLILTKQINRASDVKHIDISKYIILGQEKHATLTAQSGTENFGIAIAFAPNDTEAWGLTNEGCKYNVQAVNQAGYCINKGWNNVGYDVNTGIRIVSFESVENGIGYALIRINVPKNIQPCVQRFTVEVQCSDYPAGHIKDYFDLEVI
jgi:hypothetical protein